MREELISQVQTEALESALADLEQSATITRPEAGEFDPALLNNLDLITEN